MPEQSERWLSSEQEELIPITFTATESGAEIIRQLLEDHDIEAHVAEDAPETRLAEIPSPDRGVPVWVPHSLAEEAQAIIADREETDEFRVLDEDVEDRSDSDFGINPIDENHDPGEIEEEDSVGLAELLTGEPSEDSIEESWDDDEY